MLSTFPTPNSTTGTTTLLNLSDSSCSLMDIMARGLSLISCGLNKASWKYKTALYLTNENPSGFEDAGPGQPLGKRGQLAPTKPKSSVAILSGQRPLMSPAPPSLPISSFCLTHRPLPM